jgi:hypothetical protein
VNLNVHEFEHKKSEENIQRKKIKNNNNNNNHKKNLAKNKDKNFFFKYKTSMGKNAIKEKKYRKQTKIKANMH